MHIKINVFSKKFFTIFRCIFLAYTVFFIPSVLSKDKIAEEIQFKNTNFDISRIAYFKNDNEKTSYALGASLGSYMEHLLTEQEKLGFFLNKMQFITGIKDTILGVLKLSNVEIVNRLKNLEIKLKGVETMILKKHAEENNIQGKAYISEFTKQIGVKKTKTGLLFLIEKLGDGPVPQDNDMILVNYKGTLIDGTEFDNSYTNGTPVWLSLNNVISGWQEGIKYIKKGGQIKLVIPPQLAYGEEGVPGIPNNATLIFDIKLIDIKSILK
ncbi:MAG TPA: FKBP-type peptidyl-prolyl cis-trans isomerase [Buchnera sp. (in: enterobacteria)]|nr:FKBP-type peptidyl-prolyl cis-trans isomerase [Buchnera sp. (in: enterobacteria)]